MMEAITTYARSTNEDLFGDHAMRDDWWDCIDEARNITQNVVGNFGEGASLKSVSSLSEGLQRHTPPRRKAGQEVAGTLASRFEGGGGGRGAGTDGACAGYLQPVVFDKQRIGEYENNNVASTDSARDYKDATDLVAFDTTQITSKENGSNPQVGDPCHPLAAGAHAPCIAFNSREDPEVTGDRAGPLGASSPQAQAVAYDLRGREDGAQFEGPHDTANIRAANGGSSRSYVIGPAYKSWAVRRLTPIECERLQGFPDNFTKIPWRGKSSELCPDGPRYKAIGNSMAVNVMSWIGRRIQMVDKIINPSLTQNHIDRTHDRQYSHLSR